MNSTNIKVISEEIQRLKDQVHAIDVEVPDPSDATDGQILSVDDGKYVISDPELPATTAASTGDVLGLVGEAKTPGWITPYTPRDYSETEQNTGVKWIDGRDIYMKTYTGNVGEITAATSVLIDNTLNAQIIDFFGFVSKSASYSYFIGQLFSTTNYVGIRQGSAYELSIYLPNTSFSEYDYTLTVYYVKPAPVPTATKKKTTKKGE